MSDPVWFIERGQSEHHTPTMWWTGVNHDFTEDANLAAKFVSRMAAEAAFCQHCQLHYPKMQRATEHVFLEGGAGAATK